MKETASPSHCVQAASLFLISALLLVPHHTEAFSSSRMPRSLQERSSLPRTSLLDSKEKGDGWRGLLGGLGGSTNTSAVLEVGEETAKSAAKMFSEIKIEKGDAEAVGNAFEKISAQASEAFSTSKDLWGRYGKSLGDIPKNLKKTADREGGAAEMLKKRALAGDYLIYQLVLVLMIVTGIVPFLDGLPSLFGPLAILIGVTEMGCGILEMGDQNSPGVEPVGGKLKTEGIYSVVRHPMYGGLILSCAGWAVSTRDLTRSLLAVALLVLLRAKTGEEEKKLSEKYGSQYDKYTKEVPASFVPLLG
uniref:Steroid 5-alpha reductase C-terminal domain-containing protein n=1 Tax=Chromera velia CCMP2878 TaxID=1169474 RepID=A0A0G4I2F8_9ALVE|mmetsp:Transcript_35066/g.69201  ORF Transcript_35066/g.69201 Transcript_35066/m.69201 type:complete len:305 (+) Transcript_35066:281-1195(+)|eukprot:Cvel_10354.t1-p1 / transcript=Cvel_10354.t1 / gene=Cvel_10354 / organism=Chromera_velia_CCMP2878 / gene_product=hypothetical protein / transcript_product=hypothetical protein / location=Cvel_scaffold622:42930-46414(-) / protein_length=304 / sequence_SO=supercontig / SO=protein_coding / is_pseudo=false